MWRSVGSVCRSSCFVALGVVAGCAPVGPDDLDTVVQGIDITVSPGGSIAAAINRASPGDRILVRAGTYAGGAWIERTGTAAAPITIVSADGPRRAIISGGAEPLRVGASAYLVFDGFEVRGAGNNAVHVDTSHHITLRNLYAHDAGPDGDALKVNQSHHITIESNELARPGARSAAGVNPYQECIDLLDVDDAVVRNNFIHDGGGQLMVVKGGSRNAVIEGNLISQQRAGSTDPAVGLGGWTDANLLGGERYEAINVVFRNNVVMGGTYGAIAVYDVQGGYVAHNLLLNNDRVMVDFRAGNGPAGGSSDVRVVNNLMVDTRGRMPTAYLRSSHTATGFAATYNLFWNNGAAIPTGGLLNPTTQAGHLAANPLITAPAAAATRDTVVASARPGASSPARGSGTDATIAPFLATLDIAGVARGAGRDRGPFALSSTAPPPAPTVRFTVNPTAGAATVASTITATSTNVTSPQYRFWLVSPSGAWTMPCGDYAARSICAFTPSTAGTWQIAVSVRAATSTAQYDATTNELPYTVGAAPGGNRCPETVRTDANGDPRNLAGQIRYCWPGMAKCFCDADNDCYPLSGYVACTPI